jgi:hypothetical protein
MRMHWMPALAIAVSAAAATPRATAQTPLPAPIQRGLDAIATGGYRAAMREWTAAWTEEDIATRDRLQSAFDNLTEAAGPPIGYEVMRATWLTPGLVRVYVVLRHRGQPVFLLLVGYRGEPDWMVSAIQFHTDPQEVIPAWILDPPSGRP